VGGSLQGKKLMGGKCTAEVNMLLSLM